MGGFLRHRFIASALFSVIAVGGVPQVAFAQQPTIPAPKGDEAKARYMKGVELHEEGDFQAALIEFKKSYELLPNFHVLFNIGQEYFQLGDYVNAMKTFQQYLDDGGKRVPADKKDQVVRDLEKLKARVATINVKINVQGAEVRVDDQLQAVVLPGSVLVSTGRRKLEFSKSGYKTVTRSEDFAGQETREIVIDLQPEVTVINNNGDGTKQVVIVNGKPVEEPGPPAGPIIAWSLTGAFAIGLGVTGGLALAAQSDLDEMKTTAGNAEADLDDAASKARNMAIAADVFLAATIIGAGLSIYFTVDASLEEDPKPATPAPTAKVGVGPGSANFSLTF